MAQEPVWVIGWREWVALPELGAEAIKAKIDTGARSSALHAFNIKRFRRGQKRMVRFEIHPFQRSSAKTVVTEAEVIEDRTVRSSNGKAERRPVIVTTARMHDRDWEIELTLTNRDEMGFRMLLGRQALRGRFLIDPGRSLRTGTPVKKARVVKKAKKATQAKKLKSKKITRPKKAKRVTQAKKRTPKKSTRPKIVSKNRGRVVKPKSKR